MSKDQDLVDRDSGRLTVGKPNPSPRAPLQDWPVGRVVLQDGRQTMLFENPLQVVTVANAHDIHQALNYIVAQIDELGCCAAGFLTYEAAAAYGLATHKPPDQTLPLLWFGLYETKQLINVNELSSGTYQVGEWQAAMDWPAYETAISKIKEYIAQGHTYQVNYTMPLRAPFTGDPWALYRDLTQSQQASYMAYVDLGRVVICSASPELFFSRDGVNLIAKPMKGTAHRGRTLAEDLAQMAWLSSSTKNRAENVMIVDMIRNDFGRIAEIGSISVPELFSVERYPTVLQMTSTITARSRHSLPQIMQAMFPCASITGAPKVRTMEIIRELEQQARGIYTGSIGYVTPDGLANFNVAIRTVVVDRQAHEATYGVGGGIVWDSEAELEYRECFLKAQVLVQRYPSFELLETMLWNPENGCFLLELHLQRLADSAAYFDYNLSLDTIHEELETMTSALDQPTRIRLLVDHQGKVTLQAYPILNHVTENVVKAALAQESVSADNVWLFHKTTNRTVYERAQEMNPQADEVILWNTAGELTEATRSNIVLDLDGRLFTPPVDCGLLNGTYRQFLLNCGEISEKRLTLEDLYRCRKVHLINSVRLWQDVEIINLDNRDE